MSKDGFHPKPAADPAVEERLRNARMLMLKLLGCSIALMFVILVTSNYWSAKVTAQQSQIQRQQNQIQTEQANLEKQTLINRSVGTNIHDILLCIYQKTPTCPAAGQ